MDSYFITDRPNFQVCLVMELAKGGELFDRLLEAGSLGEREAGRVMSQVCSSDPFNSSERCP